MSSVLLPELTTTHILRGTCDLLPRIFALKPGEYILSPIKVSKGCLLHPFYRSLAFSPFYFKLKMGHVYNEGLVPGLVVDKIHIVDEEHHIIDRFNELNTHERLTQFIYDYLPFVAPNYLESDHFDIKFYVYFHWEPIDPPKKGERVITIMGYTRRVTHQCHDIYLEREDEDDWPPKPHPLKDCARPCVEHDWHGLEGGMIRCYHHEHYSKLGRDTDKKRKNDSTFLKEDEWNDCMGFFHIATYNDGSEH